MTNLLTGEITNISFNLKMVNINPKSTLWQWMCKKHVLKTKQSKEKWNVISIM